MNTRKRKSNRSYQRYGVAAVEFAVIAPLMIAFTFGLVEIGRIMLVKQTATHATREGARVAIRPSATSAQVTQRVNEELALLDIQGATIQITPADIQYAEPGEQVIVKVSVGYASISWIPGFLDFGDNQLVAESSMRRESTN